MLSTDFCKTVLLERGSVDEKVKEGVQHILGNDEQGAGIAGQI